MSFKDVVQQLRIDPTVVLHHHGCRVYRGGSTHLVTHCVCLSHADVNPSCSVNKTTGYTRCFGCGWHGDIVALHKELGGFLSMGDALADLERLSGQPAPKLQIRKHASRSREDRQKHKGRRIDVDSWRYHDASGRPVFTVQRVQYRLPDGSWVLSQKTGKPVKEYFFSHPGGRPGLPDEFKQGRLRPLFALGEILATPTDQRIIVVEGEPAADALRHRGHVATTSSGGSGLAAKTDWSPLTGRPVLIWPDNDDAGAKYADQVKGIIDGLTPPAHSTIADISSLKLPSGGDAVDWFNSVKQEAKR